MKMLETIQIEMVIWQDHNFPGRPAWVPLVGMVEEIGELAAAREVHDLSEMRDAVGDIGIYMVDFCNGLKLDVQPIWDEACSTGTKFDDTGAGLQNEIGRVAHGFLKSFQQIRMNEDHAGNIRAGLVNLVAYLQRIARVAGIGEVDEIIHSVWQQVKQRVWKKNRATAHEQEIKTLDAIIDFIEKPE